MVNGFSVASGLISGPLIARAVGPEGRGEIASAMVYFAILSLLASVGLPLAIGHALGNTKLTVSAVLGCLLRFCALLTVPSIIVAALVVNGPLSHLDGLALKGTAVLLGCVPLAVLGYCLVYVFVAQGALGPVTVIQSLQPLFITFATVMLFVLGALTVGSYIALLIAAAIGSPIIALRLLKVRPTGGASLLSLLRFGIRGYAGTLASFVTVRADQAVIGPLLGVRQLGIYAISVTIASVPSSLALAVALRSFGDIAASEDARRPEVIAGFLRLGLLVSLIVAAMIAVLSPVLLTVLYGSQFSDSLVPMLILLPGSIALTVCGGAASSLTATGRPGKVTAAELAGVAVSIVGLALIVPRHGIVSAAAVSTCAYLATLVAYVRFLREVPLRALIPGRADVRVLGTSFKSAARWPSRLRRSDNQGTTAILPE